MKGEAIVVTKASRDWKDKPSRFNQYYEFAEPLTKLPAHRFLAIQRGEREGVLRTSMDVDAERFVGDMTMTFIPDGKAGSNDEIAKAAGDAWKRLLKPSLETDARVDKKLEADRASVDVFASNLENL